MAGATVAADPADLVALDDVSTALLVVLKAMTPAERVSFVLHDVFGVPFDEIAAVIGRSGAATRQLATSARRHVREQRSAAVTRPSTTPPSAPSCRPAAAATCSTCCA